MNNNQTTYKNSPLGKIPSDWDVKELAVSGIKIIDGDRGINYPNESDFHTDGYCLFMNAKNVTKTGFLFNEKSFITKQKDGELRKGKLKRFDLVLTTRGTVGNIAYYDVSVPFDNLRINSGMVLIRIENQNIFSDFIYKCFTADILQNQIKKITFGSAQPQLTVKEINKFKIPLPPLPEQIRIAEVLSTWDKAISNVKLTIEKLQLRKKWLMQNLLTGKKRLKGFSGEWKEYRMIDLFDRVTRKNDEVNTNVVTISAQRGFVRQADFFNKQVASEILNNYFLVEKGEFCYNKSYSNGYPWGATKRLNDFDKAVVTTLYICFGIKDINKNSGNFFEQFFETNLLDKGLTKIAHEGGRAHGLLNVTPDDFFSLKITIPEFTEQTAIAQVLQTADTEIQLYKAKLEKLKEQKKGFMQVLLTGRKRLNLEK